MSADPNTGLEARLERLGRLIQVQFEARHAATLDELFFHAVNNGHHVLPYRQAALWSADQGARGRIAAVSGTAELDPDAPYIVWLSKVLRQIASTGDREMRRIGPEDLPADLQTDWAEWMPARAIWVPMTGYGDALLGGLFLARDTDWSADDESLLEQLGDAIAVAWAGFLARRPWSVRLGRRLFSRPFLWTAAALIVAAMFIPVRQSVLAPAEVIAEEPALARARLEGVVRRVYVQPNETVHEGQLLFDLDDTDLKNQLRLEELNLEVARAELRQDSHKAVFDARSNSRIQVLKGRVDIQAARVKRVRDQLALIETRATRPGVAVFDDVNDWIGRPIQAGEKVMQIADPGTVVLEASLPVSDAIDFGERARVVFFPNIDPENTMAAAVTSSSFRAAATPEGVLVYRIKATFDPSVERPRIGLRGTAKIHGGKTSLFFFLFRRPLSKTRQWLGL